MKNIIALAISLSIACVDPSAPPDGRDGTDTPSNPGGPPRGPMRATTYCVESACERCNASTDAILLICSECASDCIRVGAPSSCLDTCDGICATAYTRDCSGSCTDGAPCADEETEFEVTGEIDGTIRDACVAAMDATHCDPSTKIDWRDSCAMFSRVASRDSLAPFGCMEARGCDLAADECRLAQPHGLRAWYCDALAAREGACTGRAPIELALTAYDGWLRDEVVATLELCERETGASSLERCVERWLVAIEGG